MHSAVKESRKLYILPIDLPFIVWYNIFTVKSCDKNVYWDTKNDLAYIDIQTAKCYAIIVYSPVNNKFIKGSTTDFSITDKSFTADFSKVVFVNRSGTVTGKSSVPFVIQGAVDVHSEKIRIKIGNYTYAK